MSIKGQNTKSIRKKSLSNTRLPVVGTKNVKVHHQPATVGESYIDLSNLIVPSGTGLVNPSPSEIAKMQLKDFSSNWILTSNLRPLWMEGLSFEIVSNQTIRLLSGFESIEDEAFTIQYFNHTINGTVIADVRTPQGSGELLEGQTDFNLGEAVPIENLSSQWPMQVFRGTDGRPMLRNVSNAPYTGDDSIGNYQMIDRGDGYCQVIRFNIAGDVGNEPVMWASHGALGERPNLSTLQQVDKIHGIMDKMREDLLSVTGNDVADPTRYDNGVPTQSDLKAFGDKVQSLESRYDVSEKISSYTKTKWQINRLDGNVTAAGFMPSLAFNNLTIGKTYRVTLHVNYQGIGQKKVVIDNGGFTVGVSEMAAGSSELNLDTVAVFQATGTTLTFEKIAANGQLQGGGTNNEGTFALLEELPNHEITTEWT